MARSRLRQVGIALAALGLGGCYDPSGIQHAVRGEATGDLRFFHLNCWLNHTSPLEPPSLAIDFFPMGNRGRWVHRDHPEVFVFNMVVPAPPQDGTREGAWGTLGKVEHHEGLKVVGGAASPVRGAVMYAQGIPEANRCGPDISCPIQSREVFIEHLRVLPDTHPVPGSDQTYTFEGEVTDLRLYCLHDKLVLGVP